MVFLKKTRTGGVSSTDALISQTFQIPSGFPENPGCASTSLGSLGQFNVPAKVKGRFYSKRMCN